MQVLYYAMPNQIMAWKNERTRCARKKLRRHPSCNTAAIFLKDGVVQMLCTGSMLLQYEKHHM